MNHDSASRAVSLTLALIAPLAAQIEMVSPPQYRDMGGARGSMEPFWAQGRYQQLDGNLRGAPRVLRGLAWRLGESATSRLFELEVAMTEGDQARATSQFTANYAAPPVSVFVRKALGLPPQPRLLVRPASFGLSAPFDVPFLYSGNLDVVWEVLSWVGTVQPTVDGVDDWGGTQLVLGATWVSGPGCTPSSQYTTAWSVTRTGGNGKTTLEWQVSGGPMSAPAVLMVGTSNPDLAVPGLCSRLLTDAAIQLPGITDRTFGFSLWNATTSWSPALAAATFYAQIAVLDATRAPMPIWMSDGNAARVGPPWLPCAMTRVYQTGLPAMTGVVTVGRGVVTRYSL